MASSRTRAGGSWFARAARALLAALALALAGPPAAFASAQAPRAAPEEAHAEAVFLVNFLRYTQWPASSFGTAGAPYVVTVVGDQGTVDAVRAAAAAAGTVEGRPIRVQWLPDSRGSRSAPFDSPQDIEARAQLRRSHLVFFHRSAGAVHPQVLADLARLPVLTVSDVEGFTSGGGMLGLVHQGRRILLQANPGAIRNGGLVVSAKVLKLARAGARSLR